MDEITIITNYIQEEAGIIADLIWGHCYDENLGEKIMVTIIATGFDGHGNKREEPKKDIPKQDTPYSPLTPQDLEQSITDILKAETPEQIEEGIKRLATLL